MSYALDGTSICEILNYFLEESTCPCSNEVSECSSAL